MVKYYYKKPGFFNFKKSLKLLGFLLVIAGVLISFYSFLPLISWQIYFQPALAENIETPIPKTTVLNSDLIQSLIRHSKSSVVLDYTNASNWYPTFDAKKRKLRDFTYNLSIPRLGLEKLIVSTKDNDLSKHLVNYQGTALPPDKGNTVIFGHSTLPQLFNPKDYKTVFANAYKLENDDEILIHLDRVTYKYKVYKISVVEPEDLSPLTQDYTNHNLTLVTCTPPGTVWKRLVIKAKVEKI